MLYKKMLYENLPRQPKCVYDIPIGQSTCPHTAVDPGFHVGGHGPVGGCGPPTWALFAENVCENERIGTHRRRAPGTPPRSANDINAMIVENCVNVPYT